MIIDAHAHVGDFRWSRSDPRLPREAHENIVGKNALRLLGLA